MNYRNIEKLLEEDGFIVECWSPFEIYHEETNSRADGYAAKLICEYLEVCSNE